MKRYIQKAMCGNKYLLDSVLWKEVLDAVEDFTYKIMETEIPNLGVNDKISILGFIQEIYSISNEKEELMEKVFQIITDLREDIETGKIRNMALYGGVCNIGMFLEGLNRETGYFTKFLKSLDMYVVDTVEKICKIYSDNPDFNTFTNYDSIGGLAGVAAYLLKRGGDNNRNGVVEILKYFEKLTYNREMEGIKVPGWYVRRDFLPTQEYKEDYGGGCVNFSLSHGIAGPLFIMAKAYNKGIRISGQREAIKRVLQEYNRLSWYENGIWYAPGLLSLEEYKREGNRTNTRMSWCYGSIGILNALIMVVRVLEDSDMEAWCKHEIEEMAHMQLDRLGLESPILCHGYAGASAMFRNMYEYSNLQAALQQCHKIVLKLLSICDKKSMWGFQDIIRKKNGEKMSVEFFDKLSFLEGACGIYSELATYLKQTSNYYDEILLIR